MPWQFRLRFFNDQFQSVERQLKFVVKIIIIKLQFITRRIKQFRFSYGQGYKTVNNITLRYSVSRNFRV